MSELVLTGGCLCGNVRFELSAPPNSAWYCHCTRCQRRTGTAASAQAQIVPGSLRILAGADLIRDYAPAEGFVKAFCSGCGSALWSRHPDDLDVICIRLGAFDAGAEIRPEYRQFVAFAAPWEPLPDDGLPRHQLRRPH